VTAARLVTNDAFRLGSTVDLLGSGDASRVALSDADLSATGDWAQAASVAAVSAATLSFHTLRTLRREASGPRRPTHAAAQDDPSQVMDLASISRAPPPKSHQH
jgi:hypothetical protein